MNSVIIIMPESATLEDLHAALGKAEEELASKPVLNNQYGAVSIYRDDIKPDAFTFAGLISSLDEHIRKEIDARHRNIVIDWDVWGRQFIAQRDKLRKKEHTFLTKAMLKRIATCSEEEYRFLQTRSLEPLRQLCNLLLM